MKDSVPDGNQRKVVILIEAGFDLAGESTKRETLCSGEQ